jgi:hypothetical protein
VKGNCHGPSVPALVWIDWGESQNLIQDSWSLEQESNHSLFKYEARVLTPCMMFGIIDIECSQLKLCAVNGINR